MYIPKSRILTNQYTNDRSLVYKNSGEIYTGYYYKTFNGKYFTGKTQNDPPNDELTLVQTTDGSLTPNTPQNQLAYSDTSNTPSNQIVAAYAKLQNIDLNEPTLQTIPQQYFPTPGVEDYALGTFTRYFCVKVNQPIYLEVNIDTFKQLESRNSSWMWEPYKIFTLEWTLKGSKEYVVETNRNIVLIAERRNELVGLGRFLKDNYLKFRK